MKWTVELMGVAASLALVLTGCADDGELEGEPVDTTLRILVTNDDGVAAEGIDAIVEALAADPANEVTVCAPDGNRSGSGETTGPSDPCGELSVTSATTLSGHPATAIDGCPADAVRHALSSLYAADAPPHVVISGLNEGQNTGELAVTQLSGTVGAVKSAARSGIPGLASSQGHPETGGEFDYPAGVEAVLVWVEDHRAALLAGTAASTVESVNIPTCTSGSTRGTLSGLPFAAGLTGIFDSQDCLSTVEDPADDVEALLNGFITLNDVVLD